MPSSRVASPEAPGGGHSTQFPPLLLPAPVDRAAPPPARPAVAPLAPPDDAPPLLEPPEAVGVDPVPDPRLEPGLEPGLE